jgi:defect-in-organelle-trafficking protein DotC
MGATPAFAQQDGPTNLSVPPMPLPDDAAANPIDTPITGASEAPAIPDVARPPSLEALMAIRPGYSPTENADSGRDEAIRQAAWAYGAQGGDAAECFAINEMLRRYAPTLDRVYDFRSLVLPAGNGQTLIRPPVVTEAQMAVALAPGGQVSRETDTIYAISRQAELATAVPQWRTWLVRNVSPPSPPVATLRPRTPQEVEIWRKGVAYGWAAGQRQAVEIFLDDLGRLDREIMGMARYRVLLAGGRVQAPVISELNRDVQGGHNLMRVDDREIRIQTQPGLDGDRAHWRFPDDGQ